MFQFVFEGLLFKLTYMKPTLPALLLQLLPRIANRKPSESRFITRMLIVRNNSIRGKYPPLTAASAAAIHPLKKVAYKKARRRCASPRSRGRRTS